MKLTVALGLASALIAATFVTTSFAQDKGDKKPAPTEKPKEHGKEEKGEKKGSEADIVAHQMPLFPLTKCPTSGEELGKDAVNVVKDGRLYRFCCHKCEAAFLKDPAATTKKVDEAVIAAQLKGYPSDKDVVTGAPLGKDAVSVVINNMLFRCADAKSAEACKKDAEPYFKKLHEAYIKTQMASYPLKTCVVKGEELKDSKDEHPVDTLYGTRLVRFCCKDCAKEFHANPEKYLAMLDKAKSEPAKK